MPFILTFPRQLLFIIAFAFSFRCFGQTIKPSPNPDTLKKLAPLKQKDTTYWVENFKIFRDAIFRKDKPKTKMFFLFPLKDSSNEIWYLAYGSDEKAIDKLQGVIKPFTASDLDKYFDKIFPANFIKCILKIKTEELYKKGFTETPELMAGVTSFKLYAAYNKKANMLELNFASKTEYKDEKGNALDGGEFNVIYYFGVTKKGHIYFKKVRLAG